MDAEFDLRKFQELALFIAELSEDDPHFGATKLNKLMYYADFGCYKLLGSPISGATYQHLPAGPAPREWLPTLRSLEDGGQASLETRTYFNGVQKRLVPRRDADTSVFKEEEISIIHDVVNEFKGYNGRQISEHSHKEWAWQTTKDGEEMPYYLAWVSTDPITPEQIEVGRKIAERAGLLT